MKRNKRRLARFASATADERFCSALVSLVGRDIGYLRRFKKLNQQNWRWNKKMARKHRQRVAQGDVE